ncbi:MAG: ABC transporter ATP-binding protein [Lentisphaeria bacterium]|nr:ABC transporter ATP-binding protein [Lentisphaeria bacterium]
MAISAEKISFAYSNKKVLNNFSISLNTNDFTMLLGPNGSGKSTVIKLLGGFLPAEHGKILLDGLEIAKIPAFERARKIAVVSQIMPPVLNYTVQQMVLMGRFCHSGRLAKASEKDLQIVREAMAQMEILQFEKRYVYELSGGERQRVMLASALAQQPEYLLLDEPTAALDPAHGLRLMKILQTLNGKIGILMVCHDLNLAWNFAEKVMILNKGEITSYGETSTVLTEENILANFKCHSFIHRNEGIILRH